MDFFVVCVTELIGNDQIHDYHEFEDFEDAMDFIQQIIKNTELICSVFIQRHHQLSELELVKLEHLQKIKEKYNADKMHISQAS
jgi:hypothetical protein